MSDIRDFSPLWGEWEIESKLGEGSFGAVWKTKRNVVGGKVYYAAVKHISIPKDDSEIDRLIGEGIFSDQQSAYYFYNHLLQSLADEIDAMHKLHGYTNIVAYEDHKIIPKANGIGYDLLLRMELLEPLTSRIRKGMRVRDVVDLGKDIATAISVLYDHQMIHRDIKPQNIFVNDKGIYKLGDYGTARALSNDATAMSRKGTYNYMSPEIFNNQNADIRADIYSLGLVLYRLLNGNRLPFLPVSGNISSEDSDRAVLSRISGKPIQPPRYADADLANIVLKACAHNPEDRYTSPKEMIQDLERYNETHQAQIHGEGTARPAENSIEFQYSSTQRKKPFRTLPEGKSSTGKSSLNPAPYQSSGAPEPLNNSVQSTSAKITEPLEPSNKEPVSVESAIAAGEKHIPDTNTAKKKKILIPLIAVLACGLIVGILYGTGIFSSDKTEPVKTTATEITTTSPESGFPVAESETTENTAVYTITWLDDEGNTIDTVNAAYGTVPEHGSPSKEADEQYTYTFVGWTPEIGTVTGDTTYKAAFDAEPRVYTITWLDGEGNTIDTVSAAYGTVPEHKAPEKEADQKYTYTFTGWVPEIVTVTGNAVYNASFGASLRNYKITWLDDENRAIDTVDAAYGTTPDHKAPVKEEDEQYTYTFIGWTPEIGTVTGDTTYKAAFDAEPKVYTITWLDGEGNTIDTVSAAYGTVPEHKAPEKEADQQNTYTFIGWSPEIGAVTGDATYKALFDVASAVYTITWLDGEGNTIDTVSAAYGTVPEHKAPEKEADQQYAYTFIGWAPKIGIVTGDITYKATFDAEPRIYTITWLDGEGNTIDTVNLAYGTVPEHKAPEKEANQKYTYTFIGWTPEIGTVTGDTTYTASFNAEPRVYKITWMDDTGKIIDTTSVAYGDRPSHKPPVKESDDQYTYSFSGWQPTITTVSKDMTYKASYKNNPISHADDAGWICTACKKINSYKDIFCINCAKTMYCHECGKVVERDNFCSNCGTSAGKWKCSECGHLNGLDDNFCENCGAKRHEPNVK